MMNKFDRYYIKVGENRIDMYVEEKLKVSQDRRPTIMGKVKLDLWDRVKLLFIGELRFEKHTMSKEEQLEDELFYSARGYKYLKGGEIFTIGVAGEEKEYLVDEVVCNKFDDIDGMIKYLQTHNLKKWDEWDENMEKLKKVMVVGCHKESNTLRIGKIEIKE